MSGYNRYFIIMALTALIAMLAFGIGPVKKSDDDTRWIKKRSAMVEQIRRYGVTNELILNAMRKVRRHMFIPEDMRRFVRPYSDAPCQIGYGQTISQPFIVAYMTDQLQINKGTKVLEIGTGSGYQAAVLAELGAEVYSIEIVPELAEHARNALKSQGYENVHVLTGDGYKGWPEYAPFDAVIVTCAPDNVPKKLVEQLSDNGRMILPVGTMVQRLIIMRKKDGKVRQEADLHVRFVPMVKGK